jgi:hypothetical protein
MRRNDLHRVSRVHILMTWVRYDRFCTVMGKRGLIHLNII